MMCYGVFTASAHAALPDVVATLRAQNATARDTADSNDLLDSAIRTITTCGQAAEDRLTCLRRFKCKKALTGEDRVAERLAAKAQAAAQFKGSGGSGCGGSGGNIRIKEHERAELAYRAAKERADKNKDKDKIKGKPQPGHPARKTTTPQAEEHN
eukprot:jgi/Tetstr1/423379/TSEL_014066.t1